MRILAVDYGTKRTGIAVTDTLQIIAHPLDTIDTKVLNNFFYNYLTQEEVEEIVFGYPKHADQTDAEIFAEIKLFAENLQKKFPNIKFTFWDETYTSKIAAKEMIKAGFKKKDRRTKGNIDKIAATIILQDYLKYKK
ncbi:MAG: Holliday junction resolvase RuvX [Bacteroidales bacterium]|nr:Holliday junction resolvase RuvX [Bacteroidales bacterium]